MAVFEKRLPEDALSLSVPNILKKFDLLKNEKPTNAAVILFCKKEQKQFMQSTIKLARFKGTDKTEFLDTKMYRANAFDLYDKAIDYLTFSLPVEARIEPGKSQRVEEPAIPYSVLREAVTNALVHRDYSYAGGSIDIAIYDDRVNIANLGALPKGVKLSQLTKDHRSVPRNPLIAHVFYLCGKIEKWGRGTIDMIKKCRESGNPDPIYEEIGGSFSVTLPLRKPIRSISTEVSPSHQQKLTNRQQEIIRILKNGPLSRKQIMSKMKEVAAVRTVQADLLKLSKLGLIVPEGKTKAVIWLLVRA